MVDAAKSKGKPNYKAPAGTTTRPERFSYNGTPFDLAMRDRYYDRLAANERAAAAAKAAAAAA